ncbi:pH-response regulator protein palH/rim21 [Loxospora ochrophaea]|nr:pH-response regulator protein palH/rim21 [Loxospora ochrophaea]
MDSGRVRRQIWAIPTTTTSTSREHCTPFELPSNGLLTIDQTSVLTLTQNAVFQPECTSQASAASNASTSDSSVIDLRDPFYASTSPQIYAIAAATVISYTLVIMLFITPRTFLLGGTPGSGGFLGGHGMISGASGSTSIVGAGRRPWLQKIAAVTVAISLTIATVDTFKVAGQQYDLGYQDATLLTDEVVGGLEIRIVRVVSDTFLWLAQVQTLIRLFPRHREKVIIKWAGFALIVLDTIFSILDNFDDESPKTRPRSFVDAIPALSYLFELALSLLYAAWVIYYALEKRRFAFLHRKMRNICLVALISLTAVLIPVVFFVLDISKPDVAGWADYMRWVGAAAASVVVWEWVERIEALERDERKDGILGREIFDGDEMLEVTPSSEFNWPRARQEDSGGGGGGLGEAPVRNGWNGVSNIANFVVRPRLPPGYSQHTRAQPNAHGSNRPEAFMSGAMQPLAVSHDLQPAAPAQVASPISRADTTSAASTVYAIHYHPISESTSPTPEGPAALPDNRMEVCEPRTALCVPKMESTALGKDLDRKTKTTSPNVPASPQGNSTDRRRTLPNPFKRRRGSPPVEVSHVYESSQAVATVREQRQPRSIRSLAHSLKFNRRPPRSIAKTSDKVLPVVVVPAQQHRGRNWSPDLLRQDGNESTHRPSRANCTSPQTGPHDNDAIIGGEGTPLTSDSRNDCCSPTHTNRAVLSQRGT